MVEDVDPQVEDKDRKDHRDHRDRKDRLVRKDRRVHKDRRARKDRKGQEHQEACTDLKCTDRTDSNQEHHYKHSQQLETHRSHHQTDPER